MSIYDLIDGGCMVQGMVRVTVIGHEGRYADVYDGDGEDIPCDEAWGGHEICFLYYDKADERLVFEVQE